MTNSILGLKTLTLVSALLAANCPAQTCMSASATAMNAKITFRNGDVLTGQLFAVGSESLQFCNLALGQVSIPRQLIAEVTNIAAAPSSYDLLRQGPSVQDGAPARAEEKEMDYVSVSGPPAALSVKRANRSQTPQEPASAAQEADKKTATPALRWFFNVNAPPSVAFGTTSQQTYGGILDFQLYKGKLNRSELWTSGTYNRTWQVKTPSIYTDTFDGFFQQRRTLASGRGSFYGRAEWFFNTSLGMALQESFGPGYLSPEKSWRNFQFHWLADIRYSRERLYKSASDLNFVGSRLETQLTYRHKDPDDPTKTKYEVIARSWINPMWNDEHALQAFANLQVSVPFGRSICLNFSPIEEDFMRNAPIGNKQSYLTSSVSLKIQRSYDPKTGCY
jgi:hypothetical protein